MTPLIKRQWGFYHWRSSWSRETAEAQPSSPFSKDANGPTRSRKYSKRSHTTAVTDVWTIPANISNRIKSTFLDVFQHYFADGLATLYSSVDLSSVCFFCPLDFSGVYGVRQDCGQEPQAGILWEHRSAQSSSPRVILIQERECWTVVDTDFTSDQCRSIHIMYLALFFTGFVKTSYHNATLLVVYLNPNIAWFV